MASILPHLARVPHRVVVPWSTADLTQPVASARTAVTDHRTAASLLTQAAASRVIGVRLDLRIVAGVDFFQAIQSIVAKGPIAFVRAGHGGDVAHIVGAEIIVQGGATDSVRPALLVPGFVQRLAVAGS